MIPLSEEQEVRLTQLLNGRVAHLEDKPVPRHSPVRAGSRWGVVAAVAAMALVLAGLLALTPSYAAQVDVEPTFSGVSGDLVVWWSGAVDFGEGFSSSDPDPESLQIKRSAGGVEAVDYWADFPDVDGADRSAWPSPYRVDGGDDAGAWADRLLSLERVVRVDRMPACGEPHPVVLGSCEPAGLRVLPLTFLAVAAAVVLFVASRLGLIPPRSVVALILTLVSAILAFGAVMPVRAELERTAPAIQKIRDQFEFGDDLSCDDWYQLEIDTRMGAATGRFESIDPALVQFVLEEGRDIYFWPIFVVPVLLLAALLLPFALFQPATRRWKFVVYVAVGAAIVLVVANFPADGATNSALQCMYE